VAFWWRFAERGIHRSSRSIMSEQNPNQNLLTTKQVAKLLKVHRWTIYMWARSGRLPCIRLSKRTLRFLKKDIEKYMERHTTGKAGWK
jgi:excisionase family DNA binding protein